MLVVRDAFAGRRRFREFVDSLGIAKNVLTDRLKKLVGAGVLETVPAADGSAYHDYVLTERGRGLFLVLVALGRWRGGGPGFTLAEVATGEPVRLELRTEGGRELGP